MTRRALLLSSLFHGIVAVALLVHIVPKPPAPPPYATVELIQQDTPAVGDGPTTSGQSDQATQQAAPPPAPPAPPPIPPTVADLPPTPDQPPVPAETPALSVPMPQREAEPVPPMSPVLPTPPRQAVQQTPVREARVGPRAPPPQPPPHPDTDLLKGDPGGEPAIRLGEGGTTGTGLVENVIPAELDSRVHNKPPAYPEEAARHGEEGTVILLVHVAPDGSALSVEVRETSGHERLDQAAREAVSHWHFRPAVQDGGPVVSDMPVRVRFVLKG